ncbi:MAG: signal recognition particle-docking protein FtsY [Melioribacteraceae bacterium]|nr:signal recognition particle-docking protein FtsY [Melioribacteraceae bacterium]
MNFFKNINFNKLTDGLKKTKEKLFTGINETITGKARLDDATLDELEEILISCDIGVDISVEIIEKLRQNLKSNPDRNKESVFETLKTTLEESLTSEETADNFFEKISSYKPFVILIVGVNGAGKTTTIGKLANNFKKSGLKVFIGSGDTFRAAANEQLDIWAKRADVQIISKNIGSDPAAVAYETLLQAKKENADVVLIDTAGRLHTKGNLMEELRKIRKVLSKVLDYAPNETLLVVDGNTGQNGIIQAKEFSKYADLTGLIVTKLDGTAKGGIVFQINKELNIPVRFIGVGESIDDLQIFDAKSFISALFN